MIKAIIFDCFGVFYVDPIFEYMNDTHSPPEKAKALHELDKQSVAGLISKREFIDQAASLLGIAEVEVEQRFFMATTRNQELLEYSQLLRKSYKVGLLSNVGSNVMDAFFTPHERDEYFDAVVLSGDVGLAKPDPKIFELICKKLGVEPADALMIDDLPRFSEAARNSGMQAVVYVTSQQLMSDVAAISLT
jgi:epoxide hydrolase-like predicted phosphatase